MPEATERTPVQVAPLTPAGAPTLAYALPETQYGITLEYPPDGGVVVTVPGTKGRYLGRRLDGVHSGFEGLLIALMFVGRKLLGRPTPPRAVISLTRDGLCIREPSSELPGGELVRRWRLDEVGEVRPNRYSKGVYVRIPGRDNFDLLGDLPTDMVERVGRALQEALARLRSA